MINNDGAAPAATPDAPVEVASLPPFDRTRPRVLDPVTIELDKTRHLRLPFRALRLYEQETGLRVYDADTTWAHPSEPGFRLDALVTLLWVALLDEDPQLTIEDVWEMPGLEMANVHYLRTCLDECWGRNSPPPDAASKNGTGPKGNRLTGSS